MKTIRELIQRPNETIIRETIRFDDNSTKEWKDYSPEQFCLMHEKNATWDKIGDIYYKVKQLTRKTK